MGEGKPAHSLGPSPIPPDSHGVKNRVPKATPPVVGFCVDALPWRSGVPFFYRVQPEGRSVVQGSSPWIKVLLYVPQAPRPRQQLSGSVLLGRYVFGS